MRTFSGSVAGVAFGAEYGTVFGTDDGTASGFVDVVTADVVPGTIPGFVDEIGFGTGKVASAVELDAIPGAIHGSFSSGPGVRAFSRNLDPTAPGAAGTLAPDVE